MPPSSWPHSHKKPPTALGTGLQAVYICILIHCCHRLKLRAQAAHLASSAPMGLCLSVALWKDKVYAGRRRQALRRCHDEFDDDVMMSGRVSDDYGPPVGVGALKVEEAVAPRPSASGVLERAGTPARPIWQRRVLMGVKCQLPRFSGMILYDERGRPVCSGIRDRARDQEKHAAAINMLRDML